MQSLQNPGSALEDDFPMGGTNAIRDGLAAILDFKDNFSFHREYPDAPGPGLCLSDLGVVGLPLSKREAEVVKTHCIQAPVRKGERVFDDKTVQDTWEMDASQVKLENPRWSEFLLRIAQEVCQALAIDFTAGRPRCKLCKLRLYETGSRFLPDADTEKQDGVFATIEIVLPSKFTGGTTHFSQGELSNMYDCSPSSQHNTSVLAWCTGVSHETKPTTSGYRLALSYDLIHTTQSLRPALSAKTDLTDRLRAILMTWKKDKGRGHPLKLLYLLDRTYPQADLRVSALKGADAYKVAMLDTLAKETGFRLGFASVEFHQSGIADEDRDRGSSHYAFAEIDDATISITNFVDVEGKLIRDALEFDEETEGIPEYMTDGIEDGPVDEEDYDGMGSSLDRWYHRTVLVIWPSSSNYNMLYSGDEGFTQALKDLQGITSHEGSNNDEIELIDFVLSKADKDPAAVAQAVTRVALQWNDAPLWNNTVKTCCVHKGLAILSEDRIRSAVDHFGLEAVKSGLEDMLANDPHNAPRLEFLRHLEEWAAAMPDGAPQKSAVQQWATENTLKVLKTLRKPQSAEKQLLISIANANGGIDYLKDQLLPQIISTAEPDFLREFAIAVHECTDFPVSDARSAVTSNLLTAAVSQVRFFEPPPTMRNRYPYNTHPATSPPPTDYLALTKLYVQTARELGHPSLINTIIDRVTDTSNLDISQTQDCARTVMVPLAAFLGSSNSGSGLPSRFGHLQQEGLKLYLDWLSTHSDELTEDRAVSLLDAALACGNADVFMKSVWPRLEGINLTGTGLRLLAQHLASRRDKLVFSQGAAGPSVQSIIDTLAKRATLGSCVSVASVSDIMATLHWCTKIMCAPNLCNGVIERLLSPSVIKGNYIARVLVPLLPELKNWGIQNKQNVDYAVQKIVGLWVKRVLGGALPAKTLAKSNQVAALAGKWTCECVPCSSARTFLVESDQKRVILRDIGVPAREHVEAFLSTHADGLATCDKLNKSPQSLQIIKSDALNRIASWRANQEKGVALLKSLSTDENELRTILGPEYARVKAALAGQAAAPPATTPRMGANSSMPSASGSTKAGPPSKKRKYMT